MHAIHLFISLVQPFLAQRLKLLRFRFPSHFVNFWPGLGLPRPKAIVVIPQNQPLPKHLRKKTSKSAKHACHYATKERPVKITMYLGLDIIIKIKFTTIFDRCAILNVLNYLTKNFES